MKDSPERVSMSDFEFKLLYSRERIAAEVARVGREISRDYEGREIVLVGVLKGSFLFVADLMRQITPAVVVDFVRLASYGSQMSSAGIVEMRKDLEISIRDRDVIVVEDIVDSGCTLDYLCNKLLLKNPRSLKVCTLIDKRGGREMEIEADYVGLSMEKGFVVGYGLDYDENYRDLPEIYLVEKV